MWYDHVILSDPTSPVPVPAVLVVDDSEPDRFLLKRLIKQGNIAHNVFEAKDGEEALEFFNNYEDHSRTYPGHFPPRIVFLDINMPRVDGFEFLEAFEALRVHNPFSTVVFLLVTSSQRPEDKERAAKYEVVKGFIPKLPSSGEELAAIVKQALAKD